MRGETGRKFKQRDTTFELARIVAQLCLRKADHQLPDQAFKAYSGPIHSGQKTKANLSHHAIT
jgi:hypothetical protein